MKLEVRVCLLQIRLEQLTSVGLSACRGGYIMPSSVDLGHCSHDTTANCTVILYFMQWILFLFNIFTQPKNRILIISMFLIVVLVRGIYRFFVKLQTSLETSP